MKPGHLSLAIFFWLCSTTPVSSQEFYKGQTIRILVGASPGGSFDAFSRTIARHIGKYIPGNPTVVAENMTGAGGLVLANHLYKAAKPDGLSIANFNGGLLMGQILGRPGIEFDGRRFEYVGAPTKLDSVCVFSKSSGITGHEKWMASSTPVKVGGTAPGSNTVDMPRLLAAVLGLPTQVITGYKGFADIRLAVEGGELAGACGGWDGVKLLWNRQIESGDIIVVVQGRPKPFPDLPNAPLAVNLAKTEEARVLIQVGIHDPAFITLLYALSPGTPKDRVQVLRRAFMDTMKDPQFQVEAKKSNLNVDAADGEELARTIDGLLNLSPTMVGKLKQILK